MNRLKQANSGCGAKPKGSRQADPTALESRAIEIFVAAARSLRLPKSVGEIYGLLFVTLQPVSLEHIQNALHMSRGTASQALRQLREMGAVKRVYVLGDRTNRYLAEMELWSLATGILRERIAPQVAQGDEALADLESLIATGPADANADMQERLQLLRYWNRQVNEIIPLLIDRLASPPTADV